MSSYEPVDASCCHCSYISEMKQNVHLTVDINAEGHLYLIFLSMACAVLYIQIIFPLYCWCLALSHSVSTAQGYTNMNTVHWQRGKSCFFLLWTFWQAVRKHKCKVSVCDTFSPWCQHIIFLRTLKSDGQAKLNKPKGTVSVNRDKMITNLIIYHYKYFNLLTKTSGTESSNAKLLQDFNLISDNHPMQFV